MALAPEIDTRQGARSSTPGLFEDILAGSTTVVTVKDINGRFQWVNQRFCKRFDLTPGEVIGRDIHEILPDHIADQARHHDQIVIDQGRPVDFEERFWEDGKAVTIIASKFPLFDDQANVYAVCTISTDISERKRTEDALRNAALGVSTTRTQGVFARLVEHLSDTLNVSHAVIGLLNPDHDQRLDVVAAWESGKPIDSGVYELTACDWRTVLGKPFRIMPHGLDRAAPLDPLIRRLNISSYAACPLLDARGQPMGLIAIGNDQPLTGRAIVESVLKIYAGRAAAELERKRSEESLRIAALAVSTADGEHFFEELVQSLTTILGVRVALFGQLNKQSPEQIETLALCLDGEVGDRPVYDMEGTPCKHVVGQRFYFIPDGLRALFPQDSMIQDYGLESYAAYPLFDSQSQALGLVFIADDAPMVDPDLIESMLKIFAARAGSELERRRDEKELRAREAQYRSIFNSSLDGLILCNAEGRIVDANPAFCHLHGYSLVELLDLDPLTLIPPESQGEYETFLAAVRAGKPFNVEAKALRKDGSRFDAEIHGVQIHYEGRPHLLGVIRDISERKQRDNALRKSEDRLRATVEAGLDSIISMDSQGRIIGFNPAAEKCFGHQQSEVLGRSLAKMIIPQRHRTAHQQGLAHYKIIRKGRFIGKRTEVEAMRADGSEFPAELAIGVAQGTEEDIFIGYLRDITERKEAEAQRLALAAQLRQAQKMEAIGHLTGGIAHDFNNILTTILGYSMMALRRELAAEDPKLTRYLEQIRLSGEHARDLIQQMLTFSRGQKGEPIPLALPALIEKSVKLFGSTFPASMEFETTAEQDVANVVMDPIQVEQVLMNLCINARDATDGHGKVRISVGNRKLDTVCASCQQPVQGAFVQLAVQDTGSGISREVAERMFEPFYSTKETGKGSGMGLATVHGIVHEQGGHLGVETEPGQGSTFSILLPPVELPCAHQSGNEKAQQESDTGREHSGRVLLVDDETTVAEFMRELLESRGFEVKTAINGEDALEVLAAANDGRFDLLITDQTMPRLTGVELARKLSQSYPDLPVILYTGYRESIAPEDIDGLGIGAYLKKPIDVEELFDCIDKVLGT